MRYFTSQRGERFRGDPGKREASKRTREERSPELRGMTQTDLMDCRNSICQACLWFSAERGVFCPLYNQRLYNQRRFFLFIFLFLLDSTRISFIGSASRQPLVLYSLKSNAK